MPDSDDRNISAPEARPVAQRPRHLLVGVIIGAILLLIAIAAVQMH
ncbi:MAG TPA: hypothetical protein VMG39_02230 [Pseudolabrys sp.]|nr:hypothetical protein [Pseudolabrys sp.]